LTLLGVKKKRYFEQIESFAELSCPLKYFSEQAWLHAAK
jgi:hypothetical protein